MKKLRWNIAGCLLLVILAGALLYHMCHTTNQAMPAFVLDVVFEGEYSQDGSDWKKYDKYTKLSSFDGDLVLRGHVTEPLVADLSFYLNHIGVSIFVDGEQVFWSGRATDEVPEMMCGSYWSSWSYEGDNPETTIEICLHNPHNYGNPEAFNEFLNSLHLGNGVALSKHLEVETAPFRILGIFILIVSIGLFGTAIGYFAQKLPWTGMLFNLGFLTFLMSGYILLDTIDISFQSTLVVFNTCMRQFSMMFAGITFANVVDRLLTEERKKISSMLSLALGVFNGILILLSLTDVLAIYDTGLYWAAGQGIVFVVLLILSISQYHLEMQENRRNLICSITLLAATLIELLNGYTGWWTSGILVKTVFILLFMIYLVLAIKLVAINQKNSQKARELSLELGNSRVVLAMSQIRTHFIFNVLTAISGMCEYDPKKADEAIITFSRYLRSNINIMQEDKLEPFSKSLEHLKDYIALEQIRFGNRLQFLTDIEISDFKLPPLVLQPIIENAIKHGLFPKNYNGTIELSTQSDGKNIYIVITDDGVGFDADAMEKKESVGLSNVRFRLEYMVKGKLYIDSSPENGTRVTIIIPSKEAAV